ncbi:hypothetical protein SRB5_19520 [Streptomyces sp. RB5]|uniref:MFS transporter n=1 Tax=Streptomyces smaragdinus TaxID=2585196 RepID=A0A7K0CEQ1_9ACTN|nr:MFS transporter [Streptomyces smaragdinus]MQY11833.1 hypothetical protein [Streptomyces smaragdinus]
MSTPERAPSYAAVLRVPYAARTFLSSLAGRLSYGTVFLSLMLALTASTGSYAVAGGVIALFGLTGSLLAPVRGGLIDRIGARRALVPMAGVYAVALTALAVATWRPGAAPVWLLVVLGGFAGLCAPPIGPAMRAVWSDIVPDPALRQRAFSLDTVCEEVLLVTGPLLAGLLAAVARPALGVAVSAVLVLAGTLAFTAAPPLRSAAVRPRSARRSGGGGALPVQPVVAAAGLGVVLGALTLLLVVYADGRGRIAAVAWLEAALAVGSALGGLLYGTRTWRRPARVRLPVLTTGLALVLAVAGLAPGLWVLGGVLAVAGLLVSPALTTAYLLADETAAEEHRTRVGTWVNTAFNLGSSLGSAGAGRLAGQVPVAVCFALAAVPLLLSAGFARRRRSVTSVELVPAGR